MENFSKPTVNIFLDLRSAKTKGKDTGKYPLKLRVTIERKQNRAWNLGQSFTKDEYKKLTNNSPKSETLLNSFKIDSGMDQIKLNMIQIDILEKDFSSIVNKLRTEVYSMLISV